MITENVLMKILGDIQYKDWKIVHGFMGTGHYIQVEFTAGDSNTGEETNQRGRKFYISRHMIESEVVGTVWLAIQTAEMHEAREHFHYKRRRIYGPHISVKALARASTVREYRKRP